MDAVEEPHSLRDASGPIDDLALTLPVFLGYHLGVAFLPVRKEVMEGYLLEQPGRYRGTGRTVGGSETH